MNTTTITIPKISVPKVQPPKYTVKLVAVATAIIAGIYANDVITVNAHVEEQCGKNEIPIAVPKEHTALVDPLLFDDTTPKLSDVVAENAPTVAISKIAADNKLEVLGSVPKTPGGIFCLKAIGIKKVSATVAPAADTRKIPTTAAEVEAKFEAPVISDNYGTANIVPVEFDQTHPGRLTDQQIYSAVKVAGFKGRNIVIAIAIAKAESNGKSNARCYNVGGGCSAVPVAGVRSTDMGLFQINDKAHPKVTSSIADDPGAAAVVAYKIAKNGVNFHAWSSYNSGSYLKFIPAAEKAAA